MKRNLLSLSALLAFCGKMTAIKNVRWWRNPASVNRSCPARDWLWRWPGSSISIKPETFPFPGPIGAAADQQLLRDYTRRWLDAAFSGLARGFSRCTCL